ncbi:MAG: hypothetical protein ACJAVV_001825 [Alphaproteobacteria bacterium]|jgi:hypothetical protein
MIVKKTHTLKGYEMSRFGFIGLGIMGAPMPEHL